MQKQNKICLVAVDHGNKMIKGTSGIQYNSGYVSTGKQEPIVKSNLLLYKNEYYSIGQGRFPVMTDKTVDDRFFTLTLPAIAHAIDLEGIHGSEIDVLLSTGLPISNYSRLKANFIKYFTRDNIEFIYNDKQYKVNIKEVFCFPQGYAGFMQVFGQYKGVSVTNICDIGGYTIDCCMVENGILNIGCSFSVEMGIIKLIQEIQKSILNKTGMNISEEQVEMLLSEDDAVLFDENIKNIIEAKAEAYTNSLLDKLSEMGFELKLNPNVIIGGGGILLRRFIENNDRIKYVEFLDQFANARSYKLLSEQAIKRR